MATHLTQAAAGAACWSCGQATSQHFCEACGKIQPVQNIDYFSAFGLPRKLQIDIAALEREFYLLASQPFSAEQHARYVASGP